ncbi:hypothetical protein CQW49_22505 (plasmid) [Methylosinus trichosporium OB3b]|uniref:Uncharacterized protein n=1 Tax=Methylosinus trichosporium (strain ATCC 35070 / NCIMB 11131 / UNIQEM 75 / OB3b) TaxID=595536 RepID=A0A2D2D6W5_METT3|nr:hypothetical protein [Methylosinus trichosporium]ATQ70760.1 hypothetical protein CQW49_22505 [Methylosinus trichosporium OB3b]
MTVSFYPYIFDAGAEEYLIVETANEIFDLSNANASDLLSVLGFEALWSAPPQPILGFLDRVTAALRKSIDQPSAEIPMTIDRAPGRMTVVDCGRAEGYLNRRLHELSTLVRQGKDAGATHVGWG